MMRSPYDPIDGDVGALFPRRGGGPMPPMRNNRAGTMMPQPPDNAGIMAPQPQDRAGLLPPDAGANPLGANQNQQGFLLNGRDALLQALSDRVRRMGGGGAGAGGGLV